MTLTESKKFTNDDGSFHYKTQNLFIQEDFNEFSEILSEMTNYIISEKGEELSVKDTKKISKRKKILRQNDEDNEDSKDDSSNEFTDVSFDDI